MNEVDGSKVTNGSEDFIDTEPQDADNRKSVLTTVAGYIIVTEFCERLAYYGFAGSLVLFLQVISYRSKSCSIIHTHHFIYTSMQREFNYSNSDADVQYSLWAGFCYMTPLLGGYIADTYLGRYKTILVRHTYSTYIVDCVQTFIFRMSIHTYIHVCIHTYIHW